MTTPEQNEALVRTGPGTLMGNLLRRYWVPALLAREVAERDGPPIRVQLMGEKLICFRDSDGRIGMIGEFCAHRGVSLWFGRNEESGLRCPYHGWKYDVTGACTELPSEPEESGYRKRIKATAYPCVERGDIIWTYMGPPELQPEPPGIEWANVPADRRYVSKRLQECNFLQAMEGGIDSSHVSFLHGASLKRDPLFMGSRGNDYNVNDLMPYFEVADFDGGLLIGARRKADHGRYYWRITPWIMPWYTIIPPRADNPLGAHAWVPIDDEHCWAWSINYHPARALSATEVKAMDNGAGIHVKYIPGTFIPLANKRNDYLMDRAAQKTGETFSGIAGIGMQDASLQESMGPIQDRSTEHLCTTDLGVIRARRKLLQAAEAVRDGRDPPGVTAASQRVRSVSIELERHEAFQDGARHGLYAAADTAPVTV